MLYKISYWRIKRDTEVVLVDTTFSDACDIAASLKGRELGSGHCVQVYKAEEEIDNGSMVETYDVIRKLDTMK